MATLRIDVATADDRLAATVSADRDGALVSGHTVFPFQWTPQDEEDLRWYLEEYPSYTAPPAPIVAARIESRLVAVGTELFTNVLAAASTKPVWQAVSGDVGNLRIVVACDRPALATLPWELLRDPASDLHLATSSRAFVRIHPKPARAIAPQLEQEDLRILLAICRPRAALDVPFRSVAKHLLEGLGTNRRGKVHIDVLRPPSFENLSRRLRQAHLAGEPYDVVHFDGHGREGVLEFERTAGRSEEVGGTRVGQVLADNGVRLLILNACRSAYPQPQAEPARANRDTNHEVRALGSLAHMAADQGLLGVVAMRYSVFVETAARFMLDLYASLASGMTLGDAVNAARGQLRADPMRETIPEAIALQDWLVPQVFEAAPLRLAIPPSTTLVVGGRKADPLDGLLPRRPQAGFLGRDETLLALDRAFDRDKLVLLHAYAGSGKTATAVEFARWYEQTGGSDLILFTSFAARLTLPQVLDQLARRFARELEAQKVIWPAIQDPEDRRRVALDLLAGRRALWIWDNIEPIAGFPAGAPSQWEPEEQQELVDLLLDASEAGTRFLLTSRRDERGWLGERPTLVKLPPMPFRERLQLTRAIASKVGRAVSDVDDWRPLLEFTQGNPLTITTVVTQALRDGLRTAADISAFVGRLRSGTAEIDDEASEGRSRSLAASLGYGLENSFSEGEQRVVALLSNFQGTVNSQVFAPMLALPDREIVVDFNEQQVERVFAKASELGWLEGVSPTVYRIHPALPWFLREAFDKHFKGKERACARAFCLVEAMAASSLSKSFNRAESGALDALLAEDANFIHAYRLAAEWEEWAPLGILMNALEDLYLIQHRNTEWERLVDKSLAYLEDPTTGGPISGRELPWAIVAENQARIFRRHRRLSEAEAISRQLVSIYRLGAVPYLTGTAPLGEGHEEVHNLSAMLEMLGAIQVMALNPEGVDNLEEALDLAKRIGDGHQAALVCQNIGFAYRDIPAVADLDKSLAWLLRALDHADERNGVFVGKTLLNIGHISRLLIEKAWARESAENVGQHLKMGLRAFQKALEHLPNYALADHAEAFIGRAGLLMLMRQFPQAEQDLKSGLEFAQRSETPRFVVVALTNLASVLHELKRSSDSRVYAEAAFELCGRLGGEFDNQRIDILKLLAELREGTEGGT